MKITDVRKDMRVRNTEFLGEDGYVVDVRASGVAIIWQGNQHITRYRVDDSFEMALLAQIEPIPGKETK